MLNQLPEDCDVLCTHPMFGPESGKFGWQGLPFLYEKVRIKDFERSVHPFHTILFFNDLYRHYFYLLFSYTISIFTFCL